MQQLGSRTEADQSLTFVRDDQLTDEQRAAFEELGRRGGVIVREQQRPVANLGLMKPAAACAEIEARIPFRFRPSAEFPVAWRKLGCRPPAASGNPERTDERYCIWDEPHGDYLYKPAFVEKVVRETRTEAKFRAFIGRRPTPQSDGD